MRKQTTMSREPFTEKCDVNKDTGLSVKGIYEDKGESNIFERNDEKKRNNISVQRFNQYNNAVRFYGC